MARYNEFAGPKLPTQLLEKVYGGKVDKHGRHESESSRKAKRKAERQAKKKKVPPLRTKRPVKWQTFNEKEVDVEAKGKSAVLPAKDAKPGKSILKKTLYAPVVQEAFEEEEEEVEEEEDDDDDEEEEEEEEEAVREEEEEDDEDINTHDFTVSRSAAQAKLDDDDATIAMLEAKLGIKTKKKSNEVTDDDWHFLLNGDLGGDDDDNNSDLEQINHKGKRKRGQVSDDKDDDDSNWLQSKRKKAKGIEEDHLGSNQHSDSEDDDKEEEEGEEAPTRHRENPYIAPTTTTTSSHATAQKYIPPSLRQPSTSDQELLQSLRRQVQGQLNRLSEANLPSILKSVLEIYSSNPRQHVTSTLISLLTTRISDPSILTDTFLILHAGFSTALYRSLGPDFGAQLLESVVNTFDTHYTTNLTSEDNQKQPLNLLAFLSTLYTLQATSHEILFDYIRTLLQTFSANTETNTELLLRIIRISGPQLRSDDPSALKDIVLNLQRETSKMGGETNLSVRTKFMIETILNLKNNRVKTGIAAKALSAEHMLGMKKILGTIKGVKSTEPLRITLADLRDCEKKGKWWLVGASWKDPAKHHVFTTVPTPAADANGDDNDDADDDDDTGDRDLESLARAQGMNTSIRSALFIALVGALDPPHAQIRIGKLGLKKKQLGEIPRVLIHCAGMEKVYNHYYTCVALLFPAEGSLKKAWSAAVGDVIRRLENNAEEGEGMDVRTVYSVGKMLGSLIAESALSITILRNLPFGDLSLTANIFCQVLFTTLFISLRRQAAQQIGKGKGKEWKITREEMFHAHVQACFEKAFGVPDMLLGLRYVVEKVVRGSEGVVGEKEQRVVESGCGIVERVLREGPQGKGVVIEDEDEPRGDGEFD